MKDNHEGTRKVAIVTGGTKGIGKAIAMRLLERGYFVYVNYAGDHSAAESAKSEFATVSVNFLISRADQSDKTAFSTYISDIKCKENQIDCIVANAGATVRKALPDITDSEWDKVMEISVGSHFRLIRDLYEKIGDGARIIFIGSTLGIHPHATSLAYGVSKAAVHALARNLVKEFAGHGITVNAIAPGFVDTEWQKTKPSEIRNNIIRKTASERFGEPEEVVAAVDFCIDNAFVNGSVIEVDGGYSFR